MLASVSSWRRVKYTFHLHTSGWFSLLDIQWLLSITPSSRIHTSSPYRLPHSTLHRRQDPWWHSAHLPGLLVPECESPCTPVRCDPTYLARQRCSTRRVVPPLAWDSHSNTPFEKIGKTLEKKGTYISNIQHVCMNQASPEGKSVWGRYFFWMLPIILSRWNLHVNISNR